MNTVLSLGWSQWSAWLLSRLDCGCFFATFFSFESFAETSNYVVLRDASYVDHDDTNYIYKLQLRTYKWQRWQNLTQSYHAVTVPSLRATCTLNYFMGPVLVDLQSNLLRVVTHEHQTYLHQLTVWRSYPCLDQSSILYRTLISTKFLYFSKFSWDFSFLLYVLIRNGCKLWCSMSSLNLGLMDDLPFLSLMQYLQLDRCFLYCSEPVNPTWKRCLFPSAHVQSFRPSCCRHYAYGLNIQVVAIIVSWSH